MSENIPLINWPSSSSQLVNSTEDVVSTVSEQVAQTEAGQSTYTAKPRNMGKRKVGPVTAASALAGESIQRGLFPAINILGATEEQVPSLPETAATMVIDNGYSYVHAYLHLMYICGLSP